MNQSEREERDEWTRMVLSDFALTGWTVRFRPGVHDEGIALYDSREISMVYNVQGRVDYALILHEIAHAIVGKGGHDSHFADTYTMLVRKYMRPKEWGFPGNPGLTTRPEPGQN
jgi:hypothetical protein